MGDDDRSDRQLRVERHAQRVLGDAATRWLVDPHPALDGSRPFVVAAWSEPDAQRVERLLDNIEHPPARDLTDDEFDQAREKAAQELAGFEPSMRTSLFAGLDNDEADSDHDDC